MKKQPKRTVKKQKGESIEAIFEMYYMPVQKSKWTTAAIIIWSMCLGAFLIAFINYYLGL